VTTELQGTVALVVAGVAVVLAVVALILTVRMLQWSNRLRRAEQALLDGKPVDLVEFAVGMQARMERLEHDEARLRDEVVSALGALDVLLRRRSIVRFDANEDEEGRRSTSLALLDRHGSGIVISAVHAGSSTSVFVKDVLRGGAGSLELTPEELRAVQHALR
jgi:HAMP domain-containing protein